MYPGSVTRKGFFASITGALFGAKVAPAKALNFKAGDRIAVDFAKAAPEFTSYRFVYTAIIDPATPAEPWKWRVIDAPRLESLETKG